VLLPTGVLLIEGAVDIAFKVLLLRAPMLAMRRLDNRSRSLGDLILQRSNPGRVDHARVKHSDRRVHGQSRTPNATEPHPFRVDQDRVEPGGQLTDPAVFEAHKHKWKEAV